MHDFRSKEGIEDAIHLQKQSSIPSFSSMFSPIFSILFPFFSHSFSFTIFSLLTRFLPLIFIHPIARIIFKGLIVSKMGGNCPERFHSHFRILFNTLQNIIDATRGEELGNGFDTHICYC